MCSRFECVLQHVHELGSQWSLAFKTARGKTEPDLCEDFYPLTGNSVGLEYSWTEAHLLMPVWGRLMVMLADSKITEK